MFIGYRKDAVVPFEDMAGEKQIVVTDNGNVVVVGTDGEGWWTQTANDYDQGLAGVTMEELRARVAAVRSVIRSSGLPHDNITAFATAVVALDSVGWDGLNANDFHNGVVGLSPLILADAKRGMTTIYDPSGIRVCHVELARPRNDTDNNNG